MRPSSKRTYSLGASIAILLATVWWLIDEKFKAEPLVATLGTLATLFFQITGWKIKRRDFVLIAPPTGEPQAFPRSFDFVKDRFEVSVKPDKERNIAKYWRVGFKMSKDGRHNLYGPLEKDTLLLSIEQSGDVIDLALHENGDKCTYRNPIFPSYNFEELVISISNGTGKIQFMIKANGNQLVQPSFSVDEIYRYGNLMSWGDNNHYELNIHIEDV